MAMLCGASAIVGANIIVDADATDFLLSDMFVSDQTRGIAKEAVPAAPRAARS